MVKRAKSPEPVEDSKFLTVVHPFPLNANMEVPNDFKEFMFWLACSVGKDYALGVYHKPSARGMVVAEVSKLFQDSDKLLGEHSWNKFLYKFSSEEKERKTRVYYSTYSNARALQKDGWKNILADDELFLEFRPDNRKIRHPYPTPAWCDVPHEDPTNKRLCRPLPVETKAPPPRPPVHVPGSSTWISQKTGGKSPLQPPFVEQKGRPSMKGAHPPTAKGQTKGLVSPDAWKTPITSPTMSRSSSIPTAPSPSSTIASHSSWSKPLSTTTSSIASSTPRSVSPASATAGTDFSIPISSPSSTSHTYTPPPPGLGPPSLSSLSPPGKPSNPRGSSSITMLQTQFAGTSLSGGDGSSSIMATPSEGDEYDFEDDDSEEDFAFPLASEVSVTSDFMSFTGGVEPRTGKGPGKGKFSSGNLVTPQRNEKNERSETSWTKVRQTTARTFRKVIEEDELCPLHGVVCSKGICSVMKKRKRENEWAAKRAAKEKRTEEWRKKKRIEERGGNVMEGEEEGSDEDDDTKTEVGGPAASVAESRAASAASSSKKTTTKASSVASSIKGDWGPKKQRNAKGRLPLAPSDLAVKSDENDSEEDGFEAMAASSARPTYGGPSTANSVIFSDITDGPAIPTFDSAATISAYASIAPSAPMSNGSTVKRTPTRQSAWSAASASVSLPPASPSSRAPPSVVGSSIAATAATSSVASTPKSVPSSNVSNKSAKSTGGKGKGKANGLNKQHEMKGGGDVKGKGKATGVGKAKAKTWDEMVQDDDGSDLGSVPKFDN